MRDRTNHHGRRTASPGPLVLAATGLSLLASPAAGQTVDPFAGGQDEMFAAESALVIESDEGSAMQFQLFGDVGARASSAEGDHPAFSIGTVDFFATTELSSRARVLTESVLEILDEGAVFDLERLYAEFYFAPEFSIRLGRDHMPLGYYGQRFHHAQLFQLAAERPLVLGFEDEGGLLPAHVVGLTLMGTLSTGESLEIAYDLAVANGRGFNADDILNHGDRNLGKAVLGRITVRPLAVDGLEIGVSGSFDRIAAGADEGGVSSALGEAIFNAFFAWRNSDIDLIAEYFMVNHAYDDSFAATAGEQVSSTRLHAAFLQVGVPLGDWTPYARFEEIQRDEADLYFNASGSLVEAREVTAGVRRSFGSRLVTKLQVARGLLDDGETQVAFQAAFGL
ncbi:MAG: hypothetical protein R3F60_09925 [bacterium]